MCQKISFQDNRQYFNLYKDSLAGVASVTGHILVPVLYEKIYTTPNGFITYSKGREGLISLDGSVALPPEFDSIIPCSNNIYVFKKGEKWGLVDQNAAQLVPPVWPNAEALSDNYIRFSVNDSAPVIFSAMARRMISCHGALDYNCMNGYLLCKSLDSLGVMNEYGSMLVPMDAYDDIDEFDADFFRVKHGDSLGLFDKKGNQVTQLKYHFIDTFSQHVARVQYDGRWGLINDKGKEIARPGFDKIKIYNGYALAQRNTSAHIYDFDSRGNIIDNENFIHVVSVAVNRKERYLAVPDRFFRRGNNIPASSDRGWYQDSVNHLWGMKDSLGNIHIRPMFTSISNLNNGYYMCYKKVLPYQYRAGSYVFNLDKLEGMVSAVNMKIVIPAQYVFIDREPLRRAGWAYTRAIQKDGSYAVIRPNGRADAQHYAYISPEIYSFARFYKGGSLAVRKAVDTRYAVMSEKDYTKAQELEQHDAVMRISVKGRGSEAFMFAEKGAWGFMNHQGSVVIAPHYEYAENFDNNRTVVKCQGHWGIIDTSDANILLPYYDEILHYRTSGYSFYKIKSPERKTGIINTDGDIVTEATYDRIGPFHEGKAWAQKKHTFGFIDSSFHQVGDTDFTEVHDFSEGLAAVREKGRWGYIDKTIKVVIPCSFGRAGDFKYGLAPVCDKTGKYGYINTSGDWVIPAQYEKAYEFSADNVAIAHDDRNKYFVIDRQGKTISQKYDRIAPFSEGMAVARRGNHFFLLDSTGKSSISLRRYTEVYSFREGLARVRKKNGSGFINPLGEEVIPAEQRGCKDVQEGRTITGYAPNQDIYLVHSHAKILMNKTIITSFNEGYAVVKYGDTSYGYIDSMGRNVFDSTYLEAYPFHDGVARVRTQNGWALIDHNGFRRAQGRYLGIGAFSEGKAPVSLSGFYGLFSGSQFIAEPEYESITMQPYTHILQLVHGNQVGYMNSDGKWIWEMSE